LSEPCPSTLPSPCRVLGSCDPLHENTHILRPSIVQSGLLLKGRMKVYTFRIRVEGQSIFVIHVEGWRGAGSQAGPSAECRRWRSGDRTPRGAVAGRAAGEREGLCKLRTCGAARQLTLGAFQPSGSLGAHVHRLDGSGQIEPGPPAKGPAGHPPLRTKGLDSSWERLRVRPASSGRGTFDRRRG